MPEGAVLIDPMRMAISAIALLVSLGWVRAAEEPRLLQKVTPLPTALDRDFQFRKTKLFLFWARKAAPGTKQETANFKDRRARFDHVKRGCEIEIDQCGAGGFDYF